MAETKTDSKCSCGNSALDRLCAAVEALVRQGEAREIREQKQADAYDAMRESAMRIANEYLPRYFPVPPAGGNDNNAGAALNEALAQASLGGHEEGAR